MEKPILFSGEMVRAILEGRKTQTRRVCKSQPPNARDVSPYGEAGDRLWVRETFYHGDYDGQPLTLYRADWDKDEQTATRWKPSIFMPRDLSRLTLEITNVRAERVQDISDEDAVAEGIKFNGDQPSPADEFSALWDSINEKRGYGWDVNPYVWVIEFKQV